MSAMPEIREPAVSVRGASKSFHKSQAFAVSDLTFDVARGEFLALIGSSGSGKTTILKMLNRLIEADAGLILIAGQPNTVIPAFALRRRIGYVFQGIGLFPHLTVAENVAVTPRLLKWTESEVRERVAELLELVDLPYATYADRLPKALSGGQRQRVGFARALAARPEIVLMDEPFGALDPITRDSLARAYRALHEKFGLTTIMVTHDVNEALLMADRIGVMQEGKLVALGDPAALLAQSSNAYVQTLLAMPRAQAARIAEKFGDGMQPVHG